mgnify:CR=1 FL=1
MPRPRAYRSGKSVETGGPEWSYSQFAIGIASALLFGVTCFAIGIVVANFDSPLATENLQASNTTAEPVDVSSGQPAKPAVPVTTTPEPTKPRDITPPKANEGIVKRPDIVPSEIAPLTNQSTSPTPMVNSRVPLPPLPGVTPKDPQPVALPPIEPTNVTPPETAAPAPVPTTAKPVPSVTPPKIAPPKPAPAPAPAPEVINSSWGIQVAFFDGKERKSQAETVRSRIKSGANLDAKVVVSGDAKEYRVVLDGFPTRDAAKAACEKLKTKTGFADAWVKRLP